MKRFSIVMLLLVVGTLLFAGGTRESSPNVGSRLGVGRVEADSIIVNGTLNVTEDEVVLTSAEGSYSLSAPGARWLNIADMDDADVEVVGNLTTCDVCDHDYDGHIFIDRAVVNGEVYDFTDRGGYIQNSTAGRTGGRMTITPNGKGFANTSDNINRTGRRPVWGSSLNTGSFGNAAQRGLHASGRGLI
jgi:hypothetical protein